MVKTSTRKPSKGEEDIVGVSTATFCVSNIRDDVKEVINDLFPIWACADEERDDGTESLRSTEDRLRDSNRNTSSGLGSVKVRTDSKRKTEREEGPSNVDSDDDESSKIQGSKADTIDDDTYGDYDDDSTMITREEYNDDDTATLEGAVSKYSAIKPQSRPHKAASAREMKPKSERTRRGSLDSDSLVRRPRRATDDFSISSDEATYEDRKDTGRTFQRNLSKNKRKWDWRNSKDDDETGSVFSDLESVESFIDSDFKRSEKGGKKEGKEKRSKVGDPLGYVWDVVGGGTLMNAMTAAIGHTTNAKSKGKKTNDTNENKTVQKTGPILRSAMSKRDSHASVVSFADTNEEISPRQLGRKIAKIVSFSEEDEEIVSVGKSNVSQIQSTSQQTGRDLSTLKTAGDDAMESVASTLKTSSTLPTNCTTDFSRIKSVGMRNTQGTVDTFGPKNTNVQMPRKRDNTEVPDSEPVRNLQRKPTTEDWMNCGADAFFQADDLYDRKGVLVTESDLEENLQQLALFAVLNKHEVSGLDVDDAAWEKIDLEKDIRFSVIIVSLPLGILFQENSGGCWVARIFASGNAASTTTGTGVEVGDQLAAINGKSTSRMSVDEMCRMVASVSNPDEIELTFIRYTGPLYPSIPGANTPQRQSLLQNLSFHRRGPGERRMVQPPVAFIGRDDELGQRDCSPRAHTSKPLGNTTGRRQMSDSYMKRTSHRQVGQSQSTAQITSFRSLSPLTIGSRRSRSMEVKTYTGKPPLASKLEKAKGQPKPRPRSVTPLRTKNWNVSSTPQRQLQTVGTPAGSPAKRAQEQSPMTTPKSSGGVSSKNPQDDPSPKTEMASKVEGQPSGAGKAERKPTTTQSTPRRKGIISLFRRPKTTKEALAL